MQIEQEVTQQITQMSSEKMPMCYDKTKINKVAFLSFILFTVLCWSQFKSND